MKILNFDSDAGFTDLRFNREELRTLADILCKARKNQDFNQREYNVNTSIYMASTLLSHGCLPDFEFNHLKELRDKANTPKGELPHWELESDKEEPNPLFKLFKCSKCNKPHNALSKYCPNCGSRMYSGREMLGGSSND